MIIKYANYSIDSRNIGDNAQVYALDNIYNKMGIPTKDRVHLSRNNICEQVKKDCHYILPLVAADGAYYDLIEELMANNLEDHFSFIPISLGQTRWTFLNEDHLGKFRHVINQFEMPIGCRDYDAASMYKNLGYQAYVNGCITNTLSRRITTGKDEGCDKIYLIDVPNNFTDYIPQELLSKAIVLTQNIEGGLTAEQQYKLCTDRYELLRNTASLVVTTRYHIATPCCAMGIPTIMIENMDKMFFNWTFDTRLPALNPNIPFYTEGQWNEIDWDPKPTNFEGAKRTMIDMIVTRIKNTASIIKAADNAVRFFAPSKERFFNTCNQNIANLDIYQFQVVIGKPFLSRIKGSFKFYLYGLSNRYIEQDECLLLEYIERRFPSGEFLGFVDSKKTGSYFGKKVLSPDEMEIDEKTYCLVSAFTANDFVTQLFEQRGYDKTHLWTMPEDVFFPIYHL